MNMFVEHGNAVYPSFWHSWIGIGSLAIMGLASLHNIFSACIDDDLFDRCYYWSVVFACGAALFHIFYDSDPRGIMNVLIVGLAVRFMVSVLQRRWRYHQSGKKQSTFGRGK
jgi:hypothetical protein